ncbi:unnamed protein product [Meloidogyne enterolobii]|uniref:Uncharacterized protein n=1 Tax=Meloidogyne enterolobii TaxID=390850 RepID=A0ACB0ZHS1_MELEN
MRHFSLIIISFYLLFFLNIVFDRTHGKPNMSKTKMKESVLMNGPVRLQRKPRVPVAAMYRGVVHTGEVHRLRRQLLNIGVPTPPPVPRIPVPYPYRSKSETINDSVNDRLPSSNRIRRQIVIRAPTPPPIPSIPGVGINRRKSRSLTPSDHSAITGSDQMQMIHHKYAYIVHNSKQAGF